MVSKCLDGNVKEVISFVVWVWVTSIQMISSFSLVALLVLGTALIMMSVGFVIYRTYRYSIA